MHHRSRRITRFGAALLATALIGTVAAGCGGDSEDSSAASDVPAKPVSLALDWTPNTNHIGVYVADQLGYYDDAGIDLTVLPYAETPPETLISRGKADLGFSYQAGVAYARAAGQPVRQVFAPVQKTQYAIGVRADNDDIASPKDLDGKTYAGFGTPDEGPELEYVIKQDGGKGDFKSVALNTSAYDAVYNDRADFTISVSTWDGVEARLLKKPLKYFEFTDYGFPAQYSTAIASSDDWLAKNPDTAKAFIAATQKGYEYARENPQKAADLLVKANPQTLKNTELVNESAKMLADEKYYDDPSGGVGQIDPQVWEQYGKFLYDGGLLAGKDGKPLTAEPDWTEYYTNEYLPSS